MPRRIAQTTLNASTIDIMNVIRANASYDYQQNVPLVVKAEDIPRVGEVIYGTPAFANQFINALVNRIASVRVQSATFNNPYSILKKGYIEFGETIEDIFVGIIKAVDYSAEKGASREFKRTMPDVRSAFHTMNWRVMYPITIQDEDLRMAFLSIDGVTNLISKIVEQVYTSAEYDEFLLFKYMLIKGVNANEGSMQTVNVSADIKDSAVTFRTISNALPFMSDKYNVAHVKTTTPKDRQVIFMDARFNARFDVEVLASAFNMDKADFMGRLFLIDEWDTFDFDRFSIIAEHSDSIEPIDDNELATMKYVVAVIADENWFQIYDNKNKMTEKYVASGLYWNYFYHTWKTISYSPFANMIPVINETYDLTAPPAIRYTVDNVAESEEAYVITFVPSSLNSNLDGVIFNQTEALTTDGIGVQRFGAVLVPKSKASSSIILVADYMGETYTATEGFTATAVTVGDNITMRKNA